MRRSSHIAGERPTGSSASLEWLLTQLNRIPIGERRVRVGAVAVFPSSVDRYLAAQAWKLGLLEGPERRFLERSAREGMIAVDVGANIGLYTVTLARWLGASGRVYALEPDPGNFRALSRAVRELPHASVRLHRAAAWSSAGSLELYLSSANRGDHRSFGVEGRASLTVEAVVLDRLLEGEPRVDLVKIDAQGAEVEILKGLRRTLERSPGVRVLCELCPRLVRAAGSSDDELFELFRSARLSPHTLDRRGALALVEADRASELAERRGHVNLVFCSAA